MLVSKPLNMKIFKHAKLTICQCFRHQGTLWSKYPQPRSKENSFARLSNITIAEKIFENS